MCIELYLECPNMSLRFAKEVSTIAVIASEVSDKWKNTFTNKDSQKSIGWRQACAGLCNHSFHAVVKKDKHLLQESIFTSSKQANKSVMLYMYQASHSACAVH